MLSSFALSFAVALIATLFIVRSAHLHAGMSADNDLSGPQKFHTQPVPRIGGVGIFVGLLVGASFLLFKEPRLRHDVLALMFCALPAFASGLMEDITKRVSPLRRLLAICIGAALGVWLLGADINHTSIPGLDAIAATTIGAFLLALLVVAGVSNAINIIDGFNGLASMCCVVMLAGVAAVAMTVGDRLVASMAVLTLAATLGFFVWNLSDGTGVSWRWRRLFSGLHAG